ncbi:MAG: hypothetical protein ACHQM6_07655 [Candidatus Kapaibacterium sp.]
MKYCLSVLAALLSIFGSRTEAQSLFQTRFDMKLGCNPSSLAKTKDHGCVVVGVAYKDSAFRSGEAFISKFDSSGTLQWAEKIGDSLFTRAYSVTQTDDEGYVFCGMLLKWDSIGVYDQDVYVVKLDSTGKVEWSESVGTEYDDFGLSILQSFDGGYIIAGKSIGVGSRCYVIKLRNDGILEWTRTIGGGSEFSFNGNAIVQLKDSNFIVTGERYNLATEVQSIYLLKLSKSGNVIWSRNLKGRRLMSVNSIIRTQDNSIVLCGSILDSNNRYSDIYTAKFDTAGNLLWTTSIDALGNSSGYSIIESSLKDFIISGTISTSSYIASILSLDVNGHLKWIKSIAQTAIQTGSGSIAEVSDDGLLLLGGILESNPTRYSGFIAKLDKDGNGCNSSIIHGVEHHIGTIFDTVLTIDSGGVAIRGFADSISFGATTSDFCAQASNQENSYSKVPGILLFPDPVEKHSRITIRCSDGLPQGHFEVILRDEIGKEQSNVRITSTGGKQEIVIPISNLPAGIYTIEIVSANTLVKIWDGKFLVVE